MSCHTFESSFKFSELAPANGGNPGQAREPGRPHIAELVGHFVKTNGASELIDWIDRGIPHHPAVSALAAHQRIMIPSLRGAVPTYPSSPAATRGNP